MAPAAHTPKSPSKSKLPTPVVAKLDIPNTPTKPDKAIVKSKNNVLESSSTNALASKLDSLSISSPSSSPTKRVYHASPAKENRPTGENLQINIRPPAEPVEEEGTGMSEQAKKSLRSINALRGLTIEEVEMINCPNIKTLAT